jgi:ferrous iron transport protein A
LFKINLNKVIKTKSVADMVPGETAVISGFTDDEISVKLLEMGFLPGTAVRFNFTAPLGDPVCVSVSGLDLSLRISEASTITILN